MTSPSEPAPLEATAASFQEKLVVCLGALERFLLEIRATTSRDEMLALTLRHLQSLLPIDTAGFFFPGGPDLSFTLQMPRDTEESDRLAALVDQSIDSGAFGWALHHFRPAALRTADGRTTLILAALRTRQRILGMFAATVRHPMPAGWDANSTVLATFLATAADAIFSEELTAELQEHNRKLDGLVQQRTQQLLQAKEAAELANRAKGSFLATISHELRTPLNAILGYAQLLRGGEPLSTRQGVQVDTIRRSGEHLLSLINDLLDLSKAEAAAIELAPRPIALRQLLGDAAAIVQPQAKEKSLAFTCEFDADLPATVMVDPKRLQQVLFNLLGNAIKYTDQGSVRLQVSRRFDTIRFQVADTGCGIAEADLSRAFEPFQQLGDQARRSTGTGLGLSISKKILQAMGVSLRVQSEVGRGSRFWFELPCAPENHDPARPAGSDPDPATGDGALEDFEPLPPATVAALRELAARGDVIGIQQLLEALQSQAPAPSALAARLKRLAADCKIKSIRSILHRL